MNRSVRRLRGMFVKAVLGACCVARAYGGGVGDSERVRLIDAIKGENARLIELKGEIADALNYEKDKTEADRQIGVSQERIDAVRARVAATVESGRREIQELQKSVHEHLERLAGRAPSKRGHRRRIKSTR